MIRNAVLCLLASIGALISAVAYEPPSPARPEKPTLMIVHADWCQPCRVFDQVFKIDPVFRGALQNAFTLKSLDWQVPSERAAAIAMGIKRVPTYVVLRGNRRVAVSEGFAGSMNAAEVDRAIAELLNDLHVEWPPARMEAPQKSEVKPPRVAFPDPPRVIAGPTVDQVARDGITKLASESKQLRDAQQETQKAVAGLQSDVSAVRSQVSESREILSQQLKQSHESTRSELTTITDRLKESIERTILQPAPPVQATAPILPVPDAAIDGEEISTEMKTGPVASKWLAVLAWAGRTGLAIAAPEVAIPGSALLTAAAFALKMMRLRRAARQPAPLGHATNPIVINEAGPIRTETKFVRTETDVLGESYAEAIRRVGNLHRESQPFVVDVLQQVDAAARQLAHGQRVVRRPVTEPTSETSP
jgi:thioredoxin-like negative regulator of GroEL